MPAATEDAGPAGRSCMLSGGLLQRLVSGRIRAVSVSEDVLRDKWANGAAHFSSFVGAGAETRSRAPRVRFWQGRCASVRRRGGARHLVSHRSWPGSLLPLAVIISARHQLAVYPFERVRYGGDPRSSCGSGVSSWMCGVSRGRRDVLVCVAGGAGRGVLARDGCGTACVMAGDVSVLDLGGWMQSVLVGVQVERLLFLLEREARFLQ